MTGPIGDAPPGGEAGHFSLHAAILTASGRWVASIAFVAEGPGAPAPTSACAIFGEVSCEECQSTLASALCGAAVIGKALGS